MQRKKRLGYQKAISVSEPFKRITPIIVIVKRFMMLNKEIHRIGLNITKM